MHWLEQAYARRVHVGWLQDPRTIVLALVASVFALGSSLGPRPAVAQGAPIPVIDVGAKGATTPGGAGDEFHIKPGSKPRGRDKSPGDDLKDRDAGASPQGPGCPYRKRSLELIV